MYAHVNIWRMNDAGSSPDLAMAHDVSNYMRDQPGFRSYTMVRGNPRELVVITVFDTRDQLEQAVAGLPETIRTNLSNLSAGPPDRHEGDVEFHVEASPQGSAR